MPIIRVETLAGISRDKKRDLVQTLTRESVRIFECPPQAVTVIIDEVPKENWGASGELCSERFPDR